MLVDPFVGAAKQRTLGWVAFVGSLCGLSAIETTAHIGVSDYSNLISADLFCIFVRVVIILAAALVILGSMDYLDMEGMQRGEFYALVLFAAAGMGVLASANELVTAFV